MDSLRIFHVYNRGVDRRIIFEDKYDFQLWYSLMNRYLSAPGQVNANNRAYPNFNKLVSLQAYCLMPNHFHLQLAEHERGAISLFMSCFKTAFCKSYNIKHERTGVLFESRYHARAIKDDSDALNNSRYIHLNALAVTKDFQHFPHSSMQFYMGNKPPAWLNIGFIKGLCPEPTEYFKFHEDHIYESAVTALIQV